MRRSAAAATLLVCLPAAAFAQDGTAPHLNPDKGWYFSGKGGPSFASLSGVSASNGSQPGEDSAANVVGAFGMAGGYEWSYRYHIPLRTELEFMNRTEVTYDASPMLAGNPTSGALASTVQNVTTMARGYWHFPVGSKMWWPFVSGGLGWSHNTVKSQYTPSGGTMSKHTQSSDDLAWSVGAGATFQLGPDVMNDVEVRYVDLGKADWGLPGGRNLQADSPGHFNATEVIFSIRYMF